MSLYDGPLEAHFAGKLSDLFAVAGDRISVAGDQSVSDFRQVLNLPIRTILPFGDLFQNVLHPVKAVGFFRLPGHIFPFILGVS